MSVPIGATVTIRPGETEEFQALILDNASPQRPLSGETTIELKIRRRSDDFFYDFADDNFKAAGHTTIAKVLVEVGTTGHYEWVGGFDTSAINNPIAGGEDNYVFVVDQNPIDDAGNVPQIAEVRTRVDPAGVQPNLTTQGYTTGRAPKLDNLDDTVSSRADQADVQSALTAQGYTTGRATNLDNLDAAVSSVTTWTTTEKNQIRYRLGLDGTQAQPTSITGTLELIRKSFTNNLVLSNGVGPNNWVLLDDDDATPILQWTVTDVSGFQITLVTGQPARRTKAI